jgi:hypothetical protein
VSINGAAYQQIAADFTAGWIGRGFVDTKFVKACAAPQMEVVQQVHNDITGGGDEVVIPGDAIAVNGHRTATTREEGCSKTNVFHVLERRAGNIAAISLVAVGHVRSIVEHRYAVADKFDVAEFFRGDAGDKTIEGSQLLLRAEIEALEHVVPKCRHLTVFTPEKVLKGSGCVRIGTFRRWQLRLEPAYSHKH